jgi:hypothetical protein
MTGSKRWTSGTVYECSEIAGSPQDRRIELLIVFQIHMDLHSVYILDPDPNQGSLIFKLFTQICIFLYYKQMKKMFVYSYLISPKPCYREAFIQHLNGIVD